MNRDVSTIQKHLWLLILVLFQNIFYVVDGNGNLPLFLDNFNILKLDLEIFESEVDAATADVPPTMTFVNFYAPWCPHCQHFAPDYERLANYFATSPGIRFAVVDCVYNFHLCSKKKIDGTLSRSRSKCSETC